VAGEGFLSAHAVTAYSLDAVGLSSDRHLSAVTPSKGKNLAWLMSSCGSHPVGRATLKDVHSSSSQQCKYGQ
jgi:hypothetical protein